MNFIPYVYQTEAFNEYLNQIDWYKDSVIEITMEQDGIKHNGFEFYRYDFKNDATSFSIEFEKTGRGIRLIDTPEYSIEMNVPKPKLVYNNEYEVEFKIVNKKEQLLNLSFEGKVNKNIETNLNESISVTDEHVVTGTFKVNQAKKDQKIDRTHPVVEVDVLINGKKASFKTGIETKHPVNLKLNVSEYSHILNKEYHAYLDIENNLSTTETFIITLPNTYVTFEDSVEVTLEPKEKKSKAITYTINDYGFYKEHATIEFSGNKVTKEVHSPFKGTNTSFTCLTEEIAMMISGNYIVRYHIDGNNLGIINQYRTGADTVFFPPKIGLPFSLEFNNITQTIEFDSPNDMRVIYQSNAFKDVSIVMHVNHTFGVMTTKYELINNGPKRELALSVPIWHKLESSYVPYGEKLLKIEGNDGGFVAMLNAKLLDENWLYSYEKRYGFSWDPSDKMKITDWKMSFDMDKRILDTGEKMESINFYCSFVHPDVKGFRSFAGCTEERKEISYVELQVNDGNPFTNTDVKATLINNKQADISGTYQVDETTKDITESLDMTPGNKSIEVSLRDRLVTFNSIIHEVKGTVTQEIVDDSHVVDNGVITFKASNEYADSIYSLTFNGNEWLDSNYPTPKERAWWADFVGGITQRINGIQDLAAIKEPRTTEFVTLKDNYGNEWSGIKISLTFEKDELLKGLVFDSYSLTLPGVPMLHTFTNVTNNTGAYIPKKEMFRFSVLNIDDDQKDTVVKAKGRTMKCNSVEMDLHTRKFIAYEGKRDYKLYAYNKKNIFLAESQTDFNILFSEEYITLQDKESTQFAGDFIYFDKEEITEKHLQNLENITFEV
jgi:hypothetical protein